MIHPLKSPASGDPAKQSENNHNVWSQGITERQSGGRSLEKQQRRRPICASCKHFGFFNLDRFLLWLR
jgi:hypothetical protein